MARILFDQEHRLRNGWWVLIHLVLIAALGACAGQAARGLKHLGVPRYGFQLMPLLVTLLATWACTRLRGEPLASIGYRLDRRWAREAFGGTLLGAGLILLAAALTWAAGGVRFEPAPARALATLVAGLGMFTVVALFEETLFRGFLFQRMVDGLGPWGATAILAAAFAGAHWGNEGMVGGARIWGTLNIALAAVLLSLAWLRTRSLALPVGFHLGWNWVQGSVLGFGVSGTGVSDGWLRPVFRGRPEWLTGGAFGPEAGAPALLVLAAGIVLLWRWEGTGAPLWNIRETT